MSDPRLLAKCRIVYSCPDPWGDPRHVTCGGKYETIGLHGYAGPQRELVTVYQSFEACDGCGVVRVKKPPIKSMENPP